MQVHRLPNPNPAPTFICKQARAFRADSVKRFVWIEDTMGGHWISIYFIVYRRDSSDHHGGSISLQYNLAYVLDMFGFLGPHDSLALAFS